MNSLRDTLLNEILSQPTAPFREGHVITRITQELDAASVPYFSDPIGNLILGVSSQTEYIRLVRETTDEPLRIFIAHMDHPGFHGIQWKSEDQLEVRWHGGSPTQHLVDSKVWIADRKGWVGSGVVQEATLISSKRAIESALISFKEKFRPGFSKDTSPASSLFGGFKFRAPYWREGELIYTKAADDLVGSFAITSLAMDLQLARKKKNKAPFLGLLTRAEEVGFIGAIGHFELGWLAKAKRPVLCVSLETSRTLPGAEIGKGPVVRLGDRFTVFDPGALRVFSELAQNALPEKHQRRIMDGGTCEASAATVFGYPSIGISVPLGNYHNQSFEGGPDAAPSNGPAPEFVHLNDIRGLIELCHGLLKPKLPWVDPWKNKIKEFRKSVKDYRSLLRTGP